MVSGPAFLLQIVPDLEDDELWCFVCPEDDCIQLDLPSGGAEEMAAVYRGEGPYPCSYAGPDWERFPPGNGETSPRIWACDRCFGGVPVHDGVHVLWSTGKVEFLHMRDLAGVDPEHGILTVGKGSEDPRLATMRADED